MFDSAWDFFVGLTIYGIVTSPVWIFLIWFLFWRPKDTGANTRAGETRWSFFIFWW